jgi:uncharacterized protein (TIGR03086 family)
MDVRAFLERSTAWASTRVDGVDAGDLTHPTPCTEWDVRALLNHIVGGAVLYEAIARGAFDESLRAPDHDLVGNDPGATYASMRTALVAAFAAPGVLDRTLVSHHGERPARELCGLIAADQLVHAWDLAVATGQNASMPADCVDAARELYAGRLETRRGTTFGDAAQLPEGPTPQDELLAYCGRAPRWRPPAR